jgi:hypothetical protein
VLNYHTRVEVCGSVLEISVALNQGNTMAVSPEVSGLVTIVGNLIRAFTDLANSNKLGAGDKAAIRKLIEDSNDTLDNLVPEQTDSVLTADAPAGATVLEVDSTAGWGRGEAYETGPGTATDPHPDLTGTVHATKPMKDATHLELSAGLAGPLKVGQTIG